MCIVILSIHITLSFDCMCTYFQCLTLSVFLYFFFLYLFFFFFNDTATTEIYTLSLHDALPISAQFNASALVSSGTQGVMSFNSRRRLHQPIELTPLSHRAISFVPSNCPIQLNQPYLHVSPKQLIALILLIRNRGPNKSVCDAGEL